MRHPLSVELLGPLQVRWHGAELPVRAQRLRTLLPVLALRANQFCPASELLDAVWHDKPTEYRKALALYRGEPLAGLPGQYLAAQRQRLAERRDKVFGDRVDVDLERGRAADHAAAVGDRAKAVEYLEQALTVNDGFSPASSAGLRAKLADLQR